MGRSTDSTRTMSDRELLEEMVQRARRTETRVTVVANHLGADAGGAKPELRGDTLHVPTIRVSLEDIIAAVRDQTGPISVYCGNDYLATIGV